MNTPTGLFPELWTPPAKLPRSWGVPYRGSKSKLAKKLFEAMESYHGEALTGKTFIDPFAGGLAMSHYAVVAKGMKAVASDVSQVHVDFLKALIFDGYAQTDDFWEWVSKDTFFNRRDALSYLKRASLVSVWSFNNLEGAYCYSKDKEPIAREAHNMIVFGVEPDYEILPIGRDNFERIMAVPGDKFMGFKARRSELKKVIKDLLGGAEVLSTIEYQSLLRDERMARLNKSFPYLESYGGRNPQISNLERQEPLLPLNKVSRMEHQERSERLMSLSPLELECKDYREALNSIPDGAIVYLDPPYENTLGYTNGDKAADGSNFNHSEFWALAEEVSKAGHSVFVSGYEAPPGWSSIINESHQHIFKSTLKNVVEKLFVYER